MPTPRILILLATHNGQQHVDALLASLAAQERVDVLIDAADDHSHDGTAARLAHFAAQDPRLRFPTLGTAGGSAARNFFRLLCAADLQQIDFVAFADQDDIWHPGRLWVGVSQLRASGADLWSCATCAFWPDGTRKVLQQTARITPADYLFEGAGQGCTFLLTADFAQQLQRLIATHRALLDSVFFHDWAVYAAARAVGRRWIFDPQPRLDYRQHASNEAGARASMGGIARRLRLIQQGWYAQQVGLISAWVAAIAPHDPAVQEWRALRSRVRRSFWLATNGRRRLSDRVFQMAAALFGYL